MKDLARITFDSKIIDGKPRIHGMRVTVGIVGLIAAGHSFEEILLANLYLEEDLRESLRYAAWRVGEIEVPRGV